MKKILFSLIIMFFLCKANSQYVTLTGQQTITGNKQFTGTFYGFNGYTNWSYGEGIQTGWVIAHERLDVTSLTNPLLYLSRPNSSSNLNPNNGAVLMGVANTTTDWNVSPAIGDAVVKAEGPSALIIGASSGNIKFFNLPTYSGSSLATQSWVTSKNYITPSSVISGYIAKNSTGNTIVNSVLYENANNVGVGTTLPAFSPNTAKFLAVEATGTNIAEIGSGGNITSTTGYLGTFAFYNRAIAANEKRNAIIASANDGATNSGNLQFFTATAGSLTEKMRIDKSGNVGIGTTVTGPYKLAVEGKIGAREIKVTLANPWADYVFNENYSLRSLCDLAVFIKINKHLPGIPSASDISKSGGVELGSISIKLLEKIEELTLYTIELKKENQEIRDEIQKLKSAK